MASSSLLSDVSLVQVKTSPTDPGHKGLFATKAAKPSDVLYACSRPLLHALEPVRLALTCSWCFKSGLPGDMKACAQCRVLYYCSKERNAFQFECQKASWIGYHKIECKELGKGAVKAHVGFDMRVRMAIQAAIRRYRLPKGMSSTQWDSIKTLKDPKSVQKIEDADIHEAMAISRAWIFASTDPDQMADGENTDILETLLLKIDVNGMALIRDDFEPMGIMLDPTIARANHSCEPNAYVVMNGPRIQLRAIRPVARGEEVFIAYIDPTEPFHRRQAKLSKNYFFKCNCSLCQLGPAGKLDDFLNPIAAVPKEILAKMQQMARTIPPGDPKFDIHRPGNLPTDSEESVLLATAQAMAWERHNTYADKQDITDTAVNALVDGLRFCRDSRLFPVHRQPYASLRDHLIIASLTRADYLTATQHAIKQHLDIDPLLHPEGHHPLRVVHTIRAARITIKRFIEWVENPSITRLPFDARVAAHLLIKEALDNVGKSHGEDTAFALVMKEDLIKVTTVLGRPLPTVIRDPTRLYEETKRKMRAWVDELEY